MGKDIFRHIADIIAELFTKEETWLILLFCGLSFWFIFAFFNDLWRIIISFLLLTWPVWFFFIIFPIFESLWLFVRQAQFKRDIEWVVLELKIPREVKKSAQAMEQVFAAIHALRNSPGDIKEKYWDGEITRWYALEIVSFGGEIRFFIRTPIKQKNLVQAALFSYYSDIELEETDDYMAQLPKDMAEVRERQIDIWGTEMVLEIEEAYPIKTYEDFESMEEEKQFDPISAILEVLAKVGKEETLGIQLLIAPADPKWKEKFDDLLMSLKKPETTKVTGTEGEEYEVPISRSPGHLDTLKKMEENLSKQAFDTLLRIFYLAPKEGFSELVAKSGAVGAFNQYRALNLNGFKGNKKVVTAAKMLAKPHFFPKARKEYRKARMLWNYRAREIPPETWMGRFATSYFLNWNFGSQRFLMNVKGLATLFHPPTASVLTAPHIRRTESRRTGPPAGLPIYGEEVDIERFN